MLTLLRRLLSVGTDAAPEENFFISSGLEFYGDLVARASSGRIEGKFDGHIIECRKLIIGPHATIKGNVFAEEIVVYGYCEGNLYAAGDMKVFDTAVILGDIHASSLIVEHNATFRGNLRKLRTEDFLEITAREKEKIIQQRKSNVYNIHSLNARLEAEQRRARKVANGMPLTPETEELTSAPLKRIQTAAPIVVPNNRLAPSAVASGSDMPRAINIQASPVDVSTLTAGPADFLVPTMDEAFLPDYVVPLPISPIDSAIDSKPAETTEETAGAEVVQPTEPSASLLLLDAEVNESPANIDASPAPADDHVVELSQDEPVVEHVVEEIAALDETLEIELPSESAEIAEAVSEVEMTEDVVEEASFFMDTEDAEAMLEAQLVADESWMDAAETDAAIIEDETAFPELELSVEEINDEADLEEVMFADLSADTAEDIQAPEAPEAEVDTTERAGDFFSFPTSVTTDFIPFQVDQNDNGIRIDPSIPFIRIPDASPRIEDEAAQQEQHIQVRATFIDTTVGEVSHPVSGSISEEGVDQVPVEVLRVKASPARTMIPRQLSSPEAFELREASGTMIIIREEDEYMVEEDTTVDRRQQGGPELRGSEPLENEEPKFKISAVPTAEPGYEPGYTNQQRTNRKPVTVQPENTRRWF